MDLESLLTAYRGLVTGRGGFCAFHVAITFEITFSKVFSGHTVIGLDEFKFINLPLFGNH